ncbi:MAG: hypothetical protein ACRDQ2_02305 [Gaiellales bacterium]
MHDRVVLVVGYANHQIAADDYLATRPRGPPSTAGRDRTTDPVLINLLIRDGPSSHHSRIPLQQQFSERRAMAPALVLAVATD